MAVESLSGANDVSRKGAKTGTRKDGHAQRRKRESNHKRSLCAFCFMFLAPLRETSFPHPLITIFAPPLKTVYLVTSH